MKNIKECVSIIIICFVLGFKITMNTLHLCALVAQMVKNPPVMQEKQVPSLGWEDSLEKEMATHSSKHSCLGNSRDRGEIGRASCRERV